MRLRLWLTCLALAAGFTLVHWRTADFMSAAFQVDWHRAILENRGPYPDQYRVLTYGLAEGLIRLGLPFQLAYGLLRFVFTALALGIFGRVLARQFDGPAVLLGVLCLAWGHMFTVAYEAMQPTDPANLLAFAVALEWIATDRDLWLIALVPVSVLNRETALLIPAVAAAMRWPRPKWAIVAASTGAGFAVYFGLRLALGKHAPYAPGTPWHFWRANVEDWQTWVIVAGFFAPVIAPIMGGWRVAPAPAKRLALLLPVLTAICGTVGYLREIRLLLPGLMAVIPLALWGLESRSPADDASA